MAFALTLSANLFGQNEQAQPKTFANPLDVIIGNERAYRGGEPIVLIYKEDYYLFVSHRKGYWYGKDMQNWTYVDAPNYPGGVVSVVEMDGKLIGCSMNNKNVYRAKDPKKGIWEKIGELSSDRYGDANMFVDDDGKLYMYFGWSQIMPFKVVELDKKTFKEKGEPKVLFWSDIKNHGFEVRKPEDVIYSIFNGRREYGPEELPWIEGPYVIKHNGKYYLQYAAIGLEFISYSHGVYVSDSPMGPFKYSEHNPLTFKTSGFQVGAGHGSTFHDKKGNLWTICMIPSQYGGTGRGSELAIYPTAVDEQGVMYSNTAYGDYPQYYANYRKEGGVDNYTDWKLLSYGKKAEVSSTLEDKYAAGNACDENFLTCWAAATGDAGEYYTLDLGAKATINAIQVNWDHIGATTQAPGRMNFAPVQPQPEMTYQCYQVLVSLDNQTWTKIIDKSRNLEERKHDYTEMATPVEARYVKVVNVSCYDGAKFCIKDLRIFGTTPKAKVQKVTDFLVARNPEDRREANLLWNPVAGADGYVVRYGIEPNKLYNSYIVYDKNSLYMHSLNTAPEYYFEVEAFDSGLDKYSENPLSTIGMGAEIQLQKRPKEGGFSAYRNAADAKIMMLKEGQEEYVFDNIEPGNWILNHSYGPVLWAGELTDKELISSESNPKPTVEAKLTLMGAGDKTTGELTMKVVPGPQAGKIVVMMK